MHFKQSCLILIFSFLGLSGARAQQLCNTCVADSLFRNVYTVNATAFVKQFLPHNSHSPFSYNPYLFMYKRYGGNHTFYRVSAAYNAITNIDFFFGTSSPKNADLGLGMEKRMPLTKRIEVYYGMDLQQGYSRNFGTDFSFGIRYALAPLAGLEYFITPRIRVSTEASVAVFWASQNYFRMYRMASDFVVKDIPGGGIQFLPPDFINFSIAF